MDLEVKNQRWTPITFHFNCKTQWLMFLLSHVRHIYARLKALLYLCETYAQVKKKYCRNSILGESSFNMKGGRGGTPKSFRPFELGLGKNCSARRGSAKNLWTSKLTHDIIIQIGWFPTQQFNNLCNSAISRRLQT